MGLKLLNCNLEGEQKKSTQTFLSLEAISQVRVLQSLKKKLFIDEFPLKTCKGHNTVISLSAGDDTRPAEA